jgi:hypothetical protein
MNPYTKFMANDGTNTTVVQELWKFGIKERWLKNTCWNSNLFTYIYIYIYKGVI